MNKNKKAKFIKIIIQYNEFMYQSKWGSDMDQLGSNVFSEKKTIRAKPSQME